MKASWTVRALTALAAAPWIAPAGAQPPRAPVDISPCVGIESALARLDCYDALARQAAGSAAPAAPRAEPAARREDAAPRPVQAERAPPAAAAPVVPAPAVAATSPPGDEITSEIAALRELEPGRFEIELVNGQLWRQTSSDRYRMRIGQPVRIYPARPGGRFFRLTVPALRGFVQVERVR